MNPGISALSFVLLQGVFRRAGGLNYDLLLLSCGIRLLMFQPCLDRILICLIRSLIYYSSIHFSNRSSSVDLCVSVSGQSTLDTWPVHHKTHTHSLTHSLSLSFSHSHVNTVCILIVWKPELLLNLYNCFSKLVSVKLLSYEFLVIFLTMVVF